MGVEFNSRRSRAQLAPPLDVDTSFVCRYVVTLAINVQRCACTEPVVMASEAADRKPFVFDFVPTIREPVHTRRRCRTGFPLHPNTR